MLLRILLVGSLALALMIAIKDGRLLRNAGLLGSCRTTTAPAAVQRSSGDAQWLACTSGKLDGRPNPSQTGCTSRVVIGRTEYWACPSDVGTSPIQ
jgi:hypothetical protein